MPGGVARSPVEGARVDASNLQEPVSARLGLLPQPQRGTVSVIVPTRNEGGNVELLVGRLAVALDGLDAEILFVDDSDDDTPVRIAAVSRASELPVRLLHRVGEERVGGLGGAVLAGLTDVQSPWAVVMDGDLQHPPELVPDLLEAAERHDVDVVVATRHTGNGSSAGLANGGRMLVSSVSTIVTKLVFPRRLRGVTDPMSGFFIVRRSAFNLDAMRPDGFKILLELLVRTRDLRRHEVPFVFGSRNAGDSKASVREGMRFLRQLVRLLAARATPQWLRARREVVTRGVAFGSVGVTGIFVNSALMWLLADPTTLGLNYLISAAVATQLSSSWNFGLIDSIVYRGPKRLTRMRRWLGFLGMSNAVLLLRVPMLAGLVSLLGMHYLVANGITLMAGFLVRFSGQERLTLAKEELS